MCTLTWTLCIHTPHTHTHPHTTKKRHDLLVLFVTSGIRPPQRVMIRSWLGRNFAPEFLGCPESALQGVGLHVLFWMWDAAPQTHVLDTWSPPGSTILGGYRNLRRKSLSEELGYYVEASEVYTWSLVTFPSFSASCSLGELSATHIFTATISQRKQNQRLWAETSETMSKSNFLSLSLCEAGCHSTKSYHRSLSPVLGEFPGEWAWCCLLLPGFPGCLDTVESPGCRTW